MLPATRLDDTVLEATFLEDLALCFLSMTHVPGLTSASVLAGHASASATKASQKGDFSVLVTTACG